jgi:hypothetical protein
MNDAPATYVLGDRRQTGEFRELARFVDPSAALDAQRLLRFAGDESVVIEIANAVDPLVAA